MTSVPRSADMGIRFHMVVLPLVATPTLYNLYFFKASDYTSRIKYVIVILSIIYVLMTSLHMQIYSNQDRSIVFKNLNI